MKMKHICAPSIIARYLVCFFIAQAMFSLSVFAQGEMTQNSSGVALRAAAPVIQANNAVTGAPPAATIEHKEQSLCLPHEYSLNNGLKIILVQDKAYPLVSCFGWYKVGSRDDPVGMTGLSHLVEHLLFQNIGSFAGNQWANAIVRTGGEFSGFTSEDFTAFYSNLPSYQLELAIRGEAERMSAAHFTQADVNKEVEHLVSEAQAEDQDMPLMLNREVHAAAYERHPYHNPPGGWLHELERLSYKDAKAHYDRYFHPDNAYLVLVGGFDEQNALGLIEKYFGTIPKGAQLPVSTYMQERPQQAERQIKLKVRSGKELVEIAYKVSGLNDTDAPAISVLEQLLNGEACGLLGNKLVDAGLCSSVRVAFEQKRDPGLLVIRCEGIPVNGSAKLIQVLDSQLDQLKANLLSDTILKQALQQTEFTYYCDGDGPYRCGFQLGFFATLARGDLAYLWPQKIKQVKAADIQRVAKRYLNEENRVLGQIVIVPAPSNENKKARSISNDFNASVFHEKNILAHTLANIHFRLAAYQSGVNAPSSVSASNSATIQNTAVNAANQLNQTVKEKTVLFSDNKVEQLPISHKVLRNGLNIFVQESHLKPLVQITGALKAGAIQEAPNYHGTSKLLAAILNSGDTKNDKQQIISKQSELGLPSQAMLNFSSGRENISFQTSCLSKSFSSQMQLLFNCLREPRLENIDFEVAKNDVAVKLRRDERIPEIRIERALLRSLIAGNCSYYPIHPEEEIASIANLKLSDFRDFCAQHVNPAATTIIVCGDVKAEEVFALFEQLTEGWLLDSQSKVAMFATTNSAALKNLPPPKLVISNRSSSKSSLILPQLNPAEIVLGRIIPVSNIKQTENYWAAMLIADCALSSHPIVSRVGEQFELNPALSADNADRIWGTKIFKLADKLIWSMQVHLQPKSSSAVAITAIQDGMTEFTKCGLRQDEVLEAKRYLIGNIPVKDCANLDGLSQFIFRSVVELNEIEPMARVQRIINGLKYEDINEFIASIFKPQLASIVVAGPKELIKQVRPTAPEPVEGSSD